MHAYYVVHVVHGALHPCITGGFDGTIVLVILGDASLCCFLRVTPMHHYMMSTNLYTTMA